VPQIQKPLINIGEGILQLHSADLQYKTMYFKERKMLMVYVLNTEGNPLMPTSRFGKVRRLLKEKKAKVVKRTPFTIQLLYETENIVQKVSLGVDAGSKHIGLSATTENKVLFEADVELRSDITSLLSSRKHLRRGRRNKKRYRKPRFLNRVSTKKKGWLAPSIRQKIDVHLTVVEKVHKILPISKIIVETASFDIQKIQNPEIEGKKYQQGEQLNFWNVRKYVMHRDNHTCHHCKGKSGDKILNVHHIESRKIGGDAPNNLITLCETCHKKLHAGKIKLDIERGKRFRYATFMGIMRWSFYNKLKQLYPDVSLTFGYITQNTRIENNLEKEHYIDARCISGNPLAQSNGEYFYIKKVRCHNRQIHKCTIYSPKKKKEIATNQGLSKTRGNKPIDKHKIAIAGVKRRNQAPYAVKGFRLFDKVKYKNQECFIFGRRSSGSFSLRTLDGTHISDSISYKKLKLVEKASHYLIERRKCFLPAASSGVSALN